MAHIPHNKDLVPRARELRKRMTPQEKKLWYNFLRTYPVKIYRQRVIAGFIVDFYCAPAKLVIEVDGTYHKEPESSARDQERTAVLQTLGLSVVRLTNREIDHQFLKVCSYLHHELQAALTRQQDHFAPV